MIPRSVDLLCAQINDRIAQGDLDTALEQTKLYVELVIADDSCDGRVFSSPDLDALCTQIGAQTLRRLQDGSNAPRENLTVWIATQLYTAGGHTAVLQDMVQALPESRHLIILTGVTGPTDPQIFEARVGNFDVELRSAPDGSLLDKLVWLQHELLNLRPQRVFLFNHHQDVVAVAAPQPGLMDRLYYVHHADHQLALGVHIPHAVHIDPHNLGFFNCRDTQGVTGNVYLPMTVPDRGGRPAGWRFVQEKIVTCSSGSRHKFETSYRYSYSQVLPRLLQTTGGKHIHIGPLSPAVLQQIRADLSLAGIAQERFLHVPWVSSVWQALLDYKVDLYIVSFPYGGGRANLEAMGSGTPVVVHQHYRSRFLGGADMLYREAYAWTTPEDLMSYLANLTAEKLTHHSALARQHYEEHHKPELLERTLKSDFAIEAARPIALRPYTADSLRSAMDSIGQLNWLLLNARVLRRNAQKKSKAVSWLAAALSGVLHRK